MSKKAFDKIAEGLNEALAVARGEKKPAKLTTARISRAELTKKIHMLEAEVLDLRQRLIGGVAGVLAGDVRARQLKRWAEANDSWLRETGPKIASYQKPDDL